MKPIIRSVRLCEYEGCSSRTYGLKVPYCASHWELVIEANIEQIKEAEKIKNDE